MLQKLVPRQVFEELFAVRACTSLARAASEAAQADDNNVLLSGVREVDSLTQTALSQPSLGKHQLARLCQVSLDSLPNLVFPLLDDEIKYRI